METRAYKVPNISCGHCVRTIQSELKEVPGVRQVQVSQDEKRVEVAFEPPASDEAIRSALAEIDYPVAG